MWYKISQRTSSQVERLRSFLKPTMLNGKYKADKAIEYALSTKLDKKKFFNVVVDVNEDKYLDPATFEKEFLNYPMITNKSQLVMFVTKFGFGVANNQTHGVLVINEK
jgi:hypothetical protein